MWVRQLVRWAIWSAMALGTIAGCASSPQSLVPAQPPLAARSGALPAGLTFPDVRSGALAPDAAMLPAMRTARQGYSKKAELLFVTDWSPPQIEVYSGVATHKFKLAATITDSINSPQQIDVDSAGTLYVSSALGDYVTEFPNGAVIPSKEIANGLTEPFGVVVDNSGTLYVSNQSPPSIVEYPKGASNPSHTITSGMFGVLLGEALDASGNLYVADDVKNQVFEVPKGSTTPQSLFLEMPGCSNKYDPYYPVGLAFDRHGRLYVSCSAANNVVLVYKLPKVTPIATLSTNMNQPYLLSFAPDGSLFVANFGGGNIEELSPPEFDEVEATLSASEPIEGYVRPRL